MSRSMMFGLWVGMAASFIVASLPSLRSGNPAAQAVVPGDECRPITTKPPNAPSQQPLFEGQTRACAMSSNVGIRVDVLTTGLAHPWAVEPLPDGSLLVSERPGRLRVVDAGGRMGEPLRGLPDVDEGGQGGLLDVALSPSFTTDRLIYWSYTEPRAKGNATSVARAVLTPDMRSLENVQVIVRAVPAYDGDMHFGSRLVFGPDGMLFVTLGERSDLEMRPQAQHLDSHMGKILRVRPDGSAPADNPFVRTPGARPEIWTLGHRNVQAAAFDAQGRLWVVDHGPRGGDELNLIEKGKNYGWPLVTYGIEYSGRPVPDAVTSRAGFESPRYYWDPVIAPSGAQFYQGTAFPGWQGDLLVGSLTDHSLVRLRLDDTRVVGEERLFGERRQRIRDVREGPGGVLYVVTDEDRGELWKLVPERGR